MVDSGEEAEVCPVEEEGCCGAGVMEPAAGTALGLEVVGLEAVGPSLFAERANPAPRIGLSAVRLVEPEVG